MDDNKYDIRKPIDTPENYRMAFGLFALLGVGLVGAAVYFGACASMGVSTIRHFLPRRSPQPG